MSLNPRDLTNCHDTIVYACQGQEGCAGGEGKVTDRLPANGQPSGACARGPGEKEAGGPGPRWRLSFNPNSQL